MNQHAKPPRSVSASEFLLLQKEAEASALPSIPIIDLRSEKEFALGHIPGAVNIPLLNNSERHQVGLTYKTLGKHEAVTLGLELFAEKCALFLGAFDAFASETIGIYCWRGGMRSHLVAALLRAHGREPILLAQGYKGFRRFVGEQLDRLALHPKLVLTGRTGVGKTKVIEQLQREGLPVLDFERLARHRGSAFGGLAQDQPSPTQQNFENALIAEYLLLADCERILVEIESFIGPIRLPKNLRKTIAQAPVVPLERDFEDRVELLAQVYAEGWNEAQEAQFCENFDLMRRFLSADQCAQILAAVKQRELRQVIAQLLHLRYDGCYDKSLARHEQKEIARFNMSREEDNALSFIRSALEARVAQDNF